MNTIQRADFCGVFGSRMVMQGAQDRVPEIVDHTNYTINRVREVSLNQKQSVITADQSDESRKVHGNYFGSVLLATPPILTTRVPQRHTTTVVLL